MTKKSAEVGAVGIYQQDLPTQSSIDMQRFRQYEEKREYLQRWYCDQIARARSRDEEKQLTARLHEGLKTIDREFGMANGMMNNAYNDPYLDSPSGLRGQSAEAYHYAQQVARKKAEAQMWVTGGNKQTEVPSPNNLLLLLL